MMRNTSEQLDRRSYLKTTGLATAGMIGLAGCTGDGDRNGDGDEDAFGTLSTSITDQPNDIGDFEELLVTIDGIWILPATADEEDADDADADDDIDDADGDDTDADDADTEAEDTDEETDADEDAEDAEEAADREGRRYIEFDEPQVADLVDLQGDNTQLIDETEVEVGDYRFLQLDVSDTEGTLTDGSTADVETPGNAPLLFREEFEIRANEQTRFIADFAPQQRGRTGSYIIRPVATGTRVLYGDEEYTADDVDDGDADDNGGDADGDNDADADADGDADADADGDADAANGN